MGLGTRFLIWRRTIGLVLILTLFIVPLIIGGVGGVHFIIALFVVLPFPLIIMPYLAMALYLLFSKKPRRIDIVIIFVSVILLLSLLSPTAYVILLFFLPFIMFSTPFGLLLISILIVVLMVVLRRRRKRGMEAHKPTPTQLALFACMHCGKDLSQFPTDIKNCPYCGKQVSIPEAKVKPAEVIKLPQGFQRIRRYAKIAALLGLLIAVSSFVLGTFLGGLMGPERTYLFPILHEYQNVIGSGVLVGILIAVVSAIIRAVSGSLARS